MTSEWGPTETISYREATATTGWREATATKRQRPDEWGIWVAIGSFADVVKIR